VFRSSVGTPLEPSSARSTAAEVAALRQRAEKGDADAQSTLGIMYVIGEGVPQNYAEAYKWVCLAAEQGNTEAQHRLASWHFNSLGLVVPPDYVKAMTLYRKLADKGSAIAQFTLGVMYDEGLGIEKDSVEAHKWLNLAATRATGDNRKEFVKRRDWVEKGMGLPQVAEAQRLATEWQAAFDARQEPDETPAYSAEACMEENLLRRTVY